MGVMLLAVMGLGTIAGMMTFVVALILGQSLLSAFVLYVVAGVLTTLLVAAAVCVKQAYRPEPETLPSY